MTSRQATDIGKMLIPDIKTIIMAAIGAYIGVKVSIAEINININWLKEDIKELKHNDEIHDNSITDLQKDNFLIKGKMGLYNVRGATKLQGKE